MTRIIRISTSAYREEDFLLLTDLSDIEIKKVIRPMVTAERKSEEFFSNEDYIGALVSKYPDNFVEYYTDDSIDELEF